MAGTMYSRSGVLGATLPAVTQVAGGVVTVQPNYIVGASGNAIASDVGMSAILGGGDTGGQNNVVGGDGTATVGTASDNVASTGTGADRAAVLFGYDDVAGSLASIIAGFHCYTKTSTHATIIGGSTHKITSSGNYNGIFGGFGHTISGTAAYSAICGGNGNTVTGNYSFATGQNNVASGAACVVFGANNTCSGSYATATGDTCTASANYTRASGSHAVAKTSGQQAHSAGRFAADGDCQISTVEVRRQTSDATVTTLGVAAGNTSHSLADQSSVAFTAIAIAREAATGDSVMWEVKGLVTKQTGSNSAFIGSPTVTKLFNSAGAATWALTVTANSSTGSFQLRGQGEAAKTINWNARIDMVELVA